MSITSVQRDTTENKWKIQYGTLVAQLRKQGAPIGPEMSVKQSHTRRAWSAGSESNFFEECHPEILFQGVATY